MVIDLSTGFHFRREGEAILMAWTDREETYGFKTDFHARFSGEDSDARRRPRPAVR